MQGFTPQNRKKESAQGNASKPVPQITPKKAPSAQAQAMNQQPDSVPAMVKPGEYVLPADTVDAVGGQEALDGVVQATHTQAPDTAVVPQGFEPQYFFAQGGAVPDEENRRLVQVPASMQRRENTTFAPDNSIATPAPKPATPLASAGQTSPSNIYPQSSPSAGAPIYQGAGFNADDFGSSNKLAKVPSSIGQQPGRQPAPQYPAPKYPANYTGPKAETASVAAPTAAPAAPAKPGMTDAQRELAISQIPTGGIASPSPAAPVAPIAQAATARATNQPLDAQATADRAKIGAAWDTVKDVNDDAGRAIADVAMMVPRGLAGAYDSAVIRPMRAFGIDAGYLSPHLVPKGVDPASMTPFTDQKRMRQQVPAASTEAAPAASTAKPAPASAPAQQTPAADTPVTTAAAPVKPAATAAPVQSSTTAANPAQLPSGVYQHGRGQYSDSADGMGFTPGFTGRPNAQNLEAASNLSAQGQRESMGRVAAAMAQPQAAGFRAPTVAHSGNDFAARKRLENMATAASSITNTERWGGNGASRNPAVQAYEAAVKADLQAQGMQPDVDTKVMGFNANLMREQMSQDGATQRAVMQEAGADRRDSRRAGLESRKLGMEETAQGFQTRQAQRIEGLYQQYDAAKTDQERAAIAKQIRTYQGKDDNKNRYMAVGGGQEWSQQAGAMVNQPQRIFDTQTQQWLGGQQMQAAPMPKSQADLKVGQLYQTARGPATWDGKQFQN